MSRKVYRNIFGRTWGRGHRPYLLIPKFCCVAGFLGGLISLFVLAYLRPPPATHDEWLAHANLVSRGFRFVVVPSLAGAMALGLLLLSSHFKVFIRMRWLQVKLVLIGLFVPGLHYLMRNRALALWEQLEPGDDPARALAVRSQMAWGTLATIAFALIIITLGRVKPRLGQDYGRTFAKPKDKQGQ